MHSNLFSACVFLVYVLRFTSNHITLKIGHRIRHIYLNVVKAIGKCFYMQLIMFYNRIHEVSLHMMVKNVQLTFKL